MMEPIEKFILNQIDESPIDLRKNITVLVAGKGADLVIDSSLKALGEMMRGKYIKIINPVEDDDPRKDSHFAEPNKLIFRKNYKDIKELLMNIELSAIIAYCDEIHIDNALLNILGSADVRGLKKSTPIILISPDRSSSALATKAIEGRGFKTSAKIKDRGLHLTSLYPRFAKKKLMNNEEKEVLLA